MDQRLLRSYDKQTMKMALLMHEKIFREQVYELHRLYRVQKLLMSSRKEIFGTRPFSNNGSDELRLIEESEIQLTLGPSIYKTSQHKKRLSSRQISSFSCSNSSVSNQIQNKNAETTDDFSNSDPSMKNGMHMNLGEETLRQDRLDKQPPWQYQTFSFNLT